ncbi:MAG: hypothetical protein V4555_09750 [Acidobacteriota bacterium]
MFSFPVVLGAVLALFVEIVVPRSLGDPDIWWHLRNAQILTTTHHFITQDVFSFTALHAAWMNHEWISELPFYAGWCLGGGRGVFWVTVLEIELVTVGIYFLAYRRSGSPVGAFVVTFLGLFLSSVSYGPRTLLAGWVLLIVELLILLESEKRAWIVWLLPPVYMLWVNTHGSWMIGLVFLGLYVAANAWAFEWGAIKSKGMSAERLRSLLTASALSIAALFANPYGWRLVAYPFNMAFHQKLNIANVEEWKPLDFHSVRGDILLAALAVLAIWQIYKKREWELWELAFLGMGLYSALIHERFLYLFSIAAAPVIASRFPLPRRTAEYKPKPLLNFMILTALVIFALRQPIPAKVDDQKAMEAWPVDALPFLQSWKPQGNVFQEFLWGGYMIWNVRQVPVFVDSRVDIFEYNGTFKDYLETIHIQHSLELLDAHQIRYVLYEKDAPLAYLLMHTPGWKTDYEKGNVILLERVGAMPGKQR